MEEVFINLLKYEIEGFFAIAWQALFVLIKIVCLLISIAYYTLAERKIMAAIQRRRGPNVVGIWGLLQPLADGLKLLTKEMLIPTKANSRIFVAAPILILILSLLAWSVIPFSLKDKTVTNSVGHLINYINIVDLGSLQGLCFEKIPSINNFWDITGEVNQIADIRYGILFVLAISSLNVYGIIIGGWASNSKYAFLGALRSAAQMISYEVSISLVILPVILLAGSLNFTEIVFIQEATIWFFFPLLPCAVIFFISMLAETNRSPFDLPEAEAELVAGYNVEYSSIIFAMFFLAEYSNMILMSTLMVLLFLGGWLAPLPFLAFLPASFIFALKIVIICFLFVLVRATFPRYRYDQLMDIGWKVFLPISLGYLLFIAGILVMFDAIIITNEISIKNFTEEQFVWSK